MPRRNPRFNYIKWYTHVVDLLSIPPGHPMHIDQIYKDTHTLRTEGSDAFLRTCVNIRWENEYVKFLNPSVRTREDIHQLIYAAFPSAIARHELYGAYTHVENDIEAEIYDAHIICNTENKIEYLLKSPLLVPRLNLCDMMTIKLPENYQDYIANNNNSCFH